MLNRSAINMGKANEHGARLEFQCHCSVVQPMLVLGQAQQPSSDTAWTAAAWSGAGKAMGAHHGGSDPAGGKRAARQHAPGQVRALANTPDMGHL